MKIYATSAELKAKARESLAGHYLSFAGVFITLYVLQYLIVVPSGILELQQPFGIIFYYGLNFVLELFFAIFKVGLTLIFLSNATHQPVFSNSVFTGFWHSPIKAMQIQCLPSLLLFLPTLLSDLFIQQFFMTRNTQWLLYALVVSLIFLPYVLFVEILYSQVFYIMLDFPEMTPSECLRSARKLIKGNKRRYLYIVLSFLPLSLLGALSCGIGNLLIYPYQEQTFAYFYLDLIEKKQAV